MSLINIHTNTFSTSLYHLYPTKKPLFNHNNPLLSFKPTSNFTPNSSNSILSTPIITSPSPSPQQITDCNDKIRQLCEAHKLNQAIDLLSTSIPSKLDLGTYCFVLQCCAEHKSLQDGRRVHSVISSNTLLVDSILGAKLVFMYVHCGDLGAARLVFDQIDCKKVYLWNLLINEYSKIGDFEESVWLFGKMKVFGVVPDSYTFSSVFKCFSGLGFFEEGQKAHGFLLKSWCGENTVVVNSLISFYFRFRRVDCAQKLFDELVDRDVVSWNTMISGFVSNGCPRKGVDVFEQMISAGVLPNSTTVICVLAACSDFGNLRVAEMIHGYAVKTGYDQSLTCSNALLDMYSKCGDLNCAVEVFCHIGDRNIVSWTSMIATYAKEGLYNDAVGLFHEMINKGIKPDTFAMTTVLNACASGGLLDDGKEVHDYVKKYNLQSDLSVCNALMDMYIKCGSMEDADLVFSQLSVVDIISWNTMIGGYSKNGLPYEALTLFLEMQCKLKPDAVTMSCILPACASLAALERGKQIHGFILRNGYFSDQYVANALVDMYVKCGQLGSARIAFDMMPSKDLISWTVMIAGYCIHGLGNTAISTFNKMRNEGIEPNQDSLTSVLYSCVHSGLLNEAKRFFLIMEKKSSIELKLEHYTCMVNLLANAGRLIEAYKFVERMPLKPNAAIWGALLNGCRIHNDVELAEKVAAHIFELEPDNTAYSMLLANIYEEAKTWEKVQWLKNKIRHLGAKNQVCSWIEVNGKVQIFIAGNAKAHPEFKKIDTFLKKLRERMENEKYFQKGNHTLIEEEQLKKEVESLCGHSETSAVAFGVLNLAPGETIRVTKNSRVCHECHETIKFISKRHGREVILRDSQRFHHFKKARCSCKS